MQTSIDSSSISRLVSSRNTTAGNQGHIHGRMVKISGKTKNRRYSVVFGDGKMLSYCKDELQIIESHGVFIYRFA